MNQQQLTELTSALIQARAQTEEAKARMDRANKIILAQSGNVAPIDPETVTDSLRNEVITRLRQEYLELAAREAGWSTRYGQQHLAVISIREQMRQKSNAIENELRRIAETYKSDYEIAKSREGAAQKSLSEIVLQSNSTSEAQITLHNLESNAQTYRNLYENFMQRYTESIQRQSFPLTEARIIMAATAPTKNSQPNVPLVLSISLVGGLTLAFGIGICRDISDQVFRTASQIKTALQADCIGILPVLKGTANASDPNVRPVRGPRSIFCAPNPFWHVVDSPFSRFSEAIRSVKLAVDLCEISRSNKIIGITSSLPKEGKSTLATALALNIALGGQSRVILVDCDLRNPSLSRNLAPKADAGLLEVLSGCISLEEVIWTDPLTKLHFLPVVIESRIPNAGDILGAARTRQLFESLREGYDYVIVDLSPLVVDDARATAAFIDSYIYVIEWGRTKIAVVEHTLKSATGVYERLLGVSLNRANEKWLRRNENYRGQYKNQQYSYSE